MARLAYRDCVAIRPDAGPLFFRMLSSGMAEPWMVLRLISAVMDRPAERYIAASELAVFGEETLEAAETCLEAVRSFNPDGGVEAARAFADQYGTGMSFHMSPAKLDPEGFLAEFGQRPMVHLAELGVLGPDVAITHCVQVDNVELGVMAEAGVSVAHCPTTALKVSYGVTQVGKMPEMAMAGINLGIGTDGNNASNYSDLMRATYLVAGLFKDSRTDPQMFPAEKAYEMATLGGAKAMCAEDEIGSLEPGKKADVVLHDTDRPEWRPLLNVMNQLVWSADGRGVHTVFVDGRKVVEDGRMTTIDEERFWARCQEAGEAIATRSGLPDKAKYPVL